MLRFLSPLLALTMVSTLACQPSTTEQLGLDEPTTVQGLELDRYLGAWYEIASYPQSFQEGCEGTVAEYSLAEGDIINVNNSCTVDGEPIEANGTARPVDLEAGKLEVQFFVPIYGDYWVLEVGEANGEDAPYTHAVVGEPGRDSLWILSRTPALDESVLDGILLRIEEQSFDLDRLAYTPQPDAE